ncbi:hypothetical protein [Enterococcus gallinarum]|uniref:hypothetical protein n=1 Tax=Enterococcus gallinarum TaxID=1353 RepID=UPI001C610495|nr:hypothetical protein [Enterococcus gallinarum]MBW5474376.1 hypothetical protein [Enterococcus gallinarum]UJA23337.1 hypothetical protein HED61_07050 [Enterococcus gallinarum]
MNKIELFKQKYIQKILIEQGSMDDELNELFEFLLVNEFNNDPENMGDFIQSIVDENIEHELSDVEILKQENTRLQAVIKSMQDESEVVQTAFMEISDYVFSK